MRKGVDVKSEKSNDRVTEGIFSPDGPADATAQRQRFRTQVFLLHLVNASVAVAGQGLGVVWREKSSLGD